MGKTSKDAVRHMRELSCFFTDMREVSEMAVNYFIEKQKKKKYVKQSIKRLIEKGFLIKENGALKPSKKSLPFFRRHAVIDYYQAFNPKKWDGKWRIISFDVPVKKNRERHQLRGILEECNFYPLQRSVWATPAILTKKFWKTLTDWNLHHYCKAMVVEILEGDDNLRKYFNVSN